MAALLTTVLGCLTPEKWSDLSSVSRHVTVLNLSRFDALFMTHLNKLLVYIFPNLDFNDVHLMHRRWAAVTTAMLLFMTWHECIKGQQNMKSKADMKLYDITRRSIR